MPARGLVRRLAPLALGLALVGCGSEGTTPPAGSAVASPGTGVIDLASASAALGSAVPGGSARPDGSALPGGPAPAASGPAPSADPVSNPAPSGAGSGPPPSPGSPGASGDPVVAPSAPPAAVAHDPGKFGFSAKGMSHEVMAFVTSSQVGHALESLDFDVVSTIAFFSLEPGRDGGIKRGSLWRAWRGSATTRLIEKAHAAGTKVVISVARFSWSPSQTATSRSILSNAARRARLARELADEVVARGVDGVNVDFEPIPHGQRANFTAFVRTLRAELDERGPGYQLTFDVTGYHESYDVAGLLAPGGADAVFLMGYHYAGTWSKIARSTAPMGGGRYDISDTVKALLRSAEPEQLIVGFPYYGHVWPTKTGTKNAATTGGGFDIQYRKAIALARRLGSRMRYDPVEQVAWAAYRDRPCARCATRWYQVYFDDPRAYRHKLGYVKKRGVLGTGVWTSAFEGSERGLTNELRKAFLGADPDAGN
jgi:spore germination protein YaaH